MPPSSLRGITSPLHCTGSSFVADHLHSLRQQPNVSGASAGATAALVKLLPIPGIWNPCTSTCQTKAAEEVHTHVHGSCFGLAPGSQGRLTIHSVACIKNLSRPLEPPSFVQFDAHRQQATSSRPDESIHDQSFPILRGTWQAGKLQLPLLP